MECVTSAHQTNAFTMNEGCNVLSWSVLACFVYICGTCARGTDEEIIDSIFMQRRTFPAVHPPLDKTALRLSTEFFLCIYATLGECVVILENP